MDLRPPPAHTHKQESPVVEEFRALAFEGVPDELENPSDQKQSERIEQQAVEEDAGHKKRNREQNRGDAQCMTRAIHPVLVTGTVLRDPLLVGTSAQHARDDITTRGSSPARCLRMSRCQASPRMVKSSHGRSRA